MLTLMRRFAIILRHIMLCALIFSFFIPHTSLPPSTAHLTDPPHLHRLISVPDATKRYAMLLALLRRCQHGNSRLLQHAILLRQLIYALLMPLLLILLMLMLMPLRYYAIRPPC